MTGNTRKAGFRFSHVFLFFFSSSFLFPSCPALDFLAQNQSLKDGETLVSQGGNFELGFFSPSKSKNRYVGVWYANVGVQRVVWVANRENPVMDSFGALSIDGDGNLVVLDGMGRVLWSSSVTVISKNSTARLLDSCNLVLTDGATTTSHESVLWQSFDSPSNTFMPDMKIGVNLLTGEKRSVTSWKSEDDPAPGRFSLSLEKQVVPQIFVYSGSRRIMRSGQWNGQTFVGIPDMDGTYLNGFSLGTDEKEMLYLKFTYSNNSFVSMYVLDWSGVVNKLVLKDDTEDWLVYWSDPESQCDIYGLCGTYGSCNPSNSPICTCLKGFVPKSSYEWSKGNWSGGCLRRTQLQCDRGRNGSFGNGKADGLLRLRGVKLPDLANLSDEATDLKGCQSLCLSNCSCIACAFVAGIGCMIWANSLIDIQEFSFGGQDLFIRLAQSDLGERGNVPLLVIVISTTIGTATLFGSIYLLWKWISKNKGEISDGDGVNQMEGFELPLFNFSAVSRATDNFNVANKLGEGGFGPVYKGELPGTKQVVAVKRLSKWSGQGLEEFKNEVMLISKLQHRNLVRLLGCCIEGDEKILLYEYMPNKSLDAFLFDPAKQAKLDWAKRFHIVEGIARGLLYLHRDSRLRVIHRDLKASNILLDGEMNPKISDFGMARIFGGDQSLANTKRVVGTYGYMAPEYAMEGRFSEKSDVFSFGILLLEIVSGRKNSSFYNQENVLNLLGYAWRLWKEGNILELIDPSIADACSTSEVSRCIHVGLLCVQERETQRPSISSLVVMLGQSTSLPAPNQPAFILGINRRESSASLFCNQIHSQNEIIVTQTEGR